MKLSILILILTLLTNIYFVTIGWNNNLSDLHNFRQTQTAMNTYYILKNGFSLNYITPVLGAPWSIPMEFPLFEFIVAFFTKFTNFPLDQSGRLMNLVFFYLSVVVIFLILNKLSIKKENALLLVSLILVNPLYIYWSRTFMIESFVLFLSLLYFFLFLLYSEQVKFKLFFWCTFVGSLCAMTKITTFTIILVPLIIYIFSSLIREKSLKLSRLVILGLIVLIPILFGIFWTRYADNIKSKNPLAKDFITSNSLQEWNFGDINEKISLSTWNSILSSTQKSVSGSLWLVIFPIVTVFVYKKRRILISTCIITFLMGPLVYTNLFFVHDYYFYSTGIYLIIALGLSLFVFFENNNIGEWKRGILFGLLCVYFLYIYKNTYLPFQTQNNQDVIKISDFIKSTSNPQDVILIYGYDWNPILSYYSERKAIMDRWYLPMANTKIQQSLKYTGVSNIKMMFTTNINPDFLTERIKYFDFDEEPVLKTQYGWLFAKRTN